MVRRSVAFSGVIAGDWITARCLLGNPGNICPQERRKERRYPEREGHGKAWCLPGCVAFVSAKTDIPACF